MSKKLGIIFLLLNLVSLGLFAQEGGNPVVPVESSTPPDVEVEQEMDSAHVFEETTVETAKSTSNTRLPELPKPQRTTSILIPSNSDKDQSEAKTKSSSGKMSSNFLYYLFYKFRKVDN